MSVPLHNDLTAKVTFPVTRNFPDEWMAAIWSQHRDCIEIMEFVEIRVPLYKLEF